MTDEDEYYISDESGDSEIGAELLDSDIKRRFTRAIIDDALSESDGNRLFERGCIGIFYAKKGWHATLLREFSKRFGDPDRRRRASISSLIIDSTRRDRIHDLDRDQDDRLSRVILVAEEVNELNPEIVAAADVVIELFVTASVLKSVAEELIGPVSVPIDDDFAKLLTPTMLKLAYRPGESGDAYIERLKNIIRAASDQKNSKTNIDSRWTLDNLHGMDEAVNWGRALCKDLEDYKLGKISWSDVDRGALLAGPPGVGKTTFAKALATSSGLTFLSTSYAEWGSAGREGHQGELLKALRAVFKKARESSPCLLFIDELDSVQNRGGYRRDWHVAIINCLLSELDGIESREGVVVLGATNLPKMIDPAIRRSGRLDREIWIGLPDKSALELILREHLGDAAKEISTKTIAARLRGYTGADVEKLVRCARRRARHAGRHLATEDFLAEIGAPELLALDHEQNPTFH